MAFDFGKGQKGKLKKGKSKPPMRGKKSAAPKNVKTTGAAQNLLAGYIKKNKFRRKP